MFTKRYDRLMAETRNEFYLNQCFFHEDVIHNKHEMRFSCFTLS
jgi:hypothetical protein